MLARYRAVSFLMFEKVYFIYDQVISRFYYDIITQLTLKVTFNIKTVSAINKSPVYIYIGSHQSQFMINLSNKCFISIHTIKQRFD